MSNETVGSDSGMSPLLLTINQVSQLLGLGRTSTYELIMSKKIVSVKQGRRRLIPRWSVEKYVRDISGF
jgi:excisionase family DNA binding protein